MKIIHKPYERYKDVIISACELRDGESGICVKWFGDGLLIGQKFKRIADTIYSYGKHNDEWHIRLFDCVGNREGIKVKVKR